MANGPVAKLPKLAHPSTWEIPSLKSIDQLTVAELDTLSADLWVMSPPCQPHTRNNKTLKRDTADSRSNSFLHLIRCLEVMEKPPSYIALENVIGFETSNSCEQFKAALSQRKYNYQQFDLTPSQFGIPNERPRYYCLASRLSPLCSREESEVLFSHIPSMEMSTTEVAPLSTFIRHDLNEKELLELEVPLSVLQKPSSWCFDVRQPADSSSACFTKAYSRFIRGTGSILLVDRPSSLQEDYEVEGITAKCPSITSPLKLDSESKDSIAEGTFDANWWVNLTTTPVDGEEKRRKVKMLRYFSPEELLAVFGFDPATFQCRNDKEEQGGDSESNNGERMFGHRKCYELIGNSLNVVVVKELLQHLLLDSLIRKDP